MRRHSFSSTVSLSSVDFVVDGGPIGVTSSVTSSLIKQLIPSQISTADSESDFNHRRFVLFGRSTDPAWSVSVFLIVDHVISSSSKRSPSRVLSIPLSAAYALSTDESCSSWFCTSLVVHQSRLCWVC